MEGMVTRVRSTLAGLLLLVGAGLVAMQFDQPDVSNEYTRVPPVPATDRDREHRVRFWVRFTPERPVDVTWFAQPDGDELTATGTPWTRVAFVDDGAILSLTARERPGTYGERVVICEVEVDGQRVRFSEKMTGCNLRYTVP